MAVATTGPAERSPGTAVYSVIAEKHLGLFAQAIASQGVPAYQQEIPPTGKIDTPANMGGTAFPADARTYRDLTPGRPEINHDPMSAALIGPGYFAAQTPRGVAIHGRGSLR